MNLAAQALALLQIHHDKMPIIDQDTFLDLRHSLVVNGLQGHLQTL
jgi:hypothetical protein